MKQSSIKQSATLPPIWALVAVLFLAGGWLLLQLKEMIVLLVVGYAIAYVMRPALLFLEKKGVGRTAGCIVIFALSSAFFLVLAITILPTILSELTQLANRLPELIPTARERLLAHYHRIHDYIPKSYHRQIDDATSSLVPSFGPKAIQGILGGMASALLSGYSLTLTLVNIALLPFIVYYLAVDFEEMHTRALTLFPKHLRKSVREMAREVDILMSAFVRGQFVVGFLLALLFMVALGFIGIELWFAIALISGFGNLVPYLGSLIGILLASLMALVTFGDLQHLVFVWAAFGLIQFIEGSFITPHVVGDKVGLSPLAVILAIFAFGKLLGLLGVFLAVPFAAIFRVTTRQGHRWLLAQMER